MLKLVVCVFSILFLILAPNIVFNKESYTQNIMKYLINGKKEQVVLNIWHVETFEGGKKSRKKFLEEAGIKYNKTNSSIFVSVVSLTEEQLFLNLQNGLTFDLISFGIGSGSLLSSFLQPLEKKDNVKSNLYEYCTINNQIMAYPYMMSCYVAISKDNDASKLLKDKLNLGSNKNNFNFGFATKDYINPARAVEEMDINNLNKNIFYAATTSYDAYKHFVGGSFKTLVGTIRDYYRCKNREEIGKINSCSYQILGEYTDLVQYVGLNKNIAENKKDVAKAFLNYLISSPIQTNIKNYGLFPAIELEIYDDVFLHNAELLLKKIKSINVFSSVTDIENNKQNSMSKIFS